MSAIFFVFLGCIRFVNFLHALPLLRRALAVGRDWGRVPSLRAWGCGVGWRRGGVVRPVRVAWTVGAAAFLGVRLGRVGRSAVGAGRLLLVGGARVARGRCIRCCSFCFSGWAVLSASLGRGISGASSSRPLLSCAAGSVRAAAVWWLAALGAAALGVVFGAGHKRRHEGVPSFCPRAGVLRVSPVVASPGAGASFFPSPSPPSARARVVGWRSGCPSGGRLLAQVSGGAAGCPVRGVVATPGSSMHLRTVGARCQSRIIDVAQSGPAAAHALRGFLDVHFVHDHKSYCRFL